MSIAVHHSPSLPWPMDVPLPSVANLVFSFIRGPIEVTFGGPPMTVLPMPVVSVRLPSHWCTCKVGCMNIRSPPILSSVPGPSSAATDLCTVGPGRWHTVDPGRSPVPVVPFLPSTASDRGKLCSCRARCVGPSVSSSPMSAAVSTLPPSFGCDDETPCNNFVSHSDA